MPTYRIEIEADVVLKVSELELIAREVKMIVDTDYDEECTVTAKYD